MSRPRGNKTSKATRAEREGRVIAKLGENKSQTTIAKEIGVSRSTVWRHLQKMTLLMSENNASQFAELRKTQVGALADMAAEVHRGKVAPDVANAWGGLMKQIASILGLNAPTRTISAKIDANVDPEKLVGYRKFVYETRGLDQAQIDQVYAFARSLVRVRETPPGPPASSPLWNDAPLLEGETDEV